MTTTQQEALTGNFAPVSAETTANNLSVIEGSIPKDLDGLFVRNGPNPQYPPVKGYHWFMGDGMLHAVRFSASQASFINRFVQTEAYLYEKKLGRAYFYSIFTDMIGIPSVISMMYHSARTSYLGGAPNPWKKRTANTALVYHDKRLMALVEGDVPTWVMAQTLDTIGPYNYNNKLTHAFTAHPKVDPETGEMIFFGYDATTPYIKYNTVSKEGKLSDDVKVKVQAPIMMHDCAITKNHTIFLDLPMVYDGKKAAMTDGLIGTFRPELPSRIGIGERHMKDDTKIKWFELPSFYMYHTANAWEEGSKVHLYGSRYAKLPFDLSFVGRKDFGVMHHWCFDLKTGKVEEEPIMPSDYDTEFPVINNDYLGRKCQFSYYAIRTSSALQHYNGVEKIDLETKEKTRWLHGSDRYGGEFVFVKKTSGCDTEDDGYLVGYVYDETKNNSEVVVLSALDMSLVCRVALSQRVPYGFHGLWVTKDQLNMQRSA